MYIAFKWLVGLTFLMWFLMCGIDVFIRTLRKGNAIGIYLKEDEDVYKNISVPIKSPPKRGIIINKVNRSKNQQVNGIFNFAVLFAAGFFIFILNNKKKIILQLTNRIYNIEGSILHKYLNNLINFKGRLNIRCNALSNYLSHAWGDLGREIKKSVLNHDEVNRALLNKLEEVSNEKKSLSLLLAASIFENRNIKFNYKLESLAQKKLEQYTEETDKKLKEVLSDKIHYQNLYLIATQENMELRAKVKTFKELREHAEINLIRLVHEVCMSRNAKLMAYCSRLVVQSKDDLLRSDMRAEIQKFLRSTKAIATKHQVETRTTLCTKSLVSQGSNTFTRSACDAPLMAGNKSEHIWTVKNKNGFIEKLYECDLTTDLNNGLIKRIREYSVYHDKDCFFKNSNSRTRVHDISCCGEDYYKELGKLRVCDKIQNHRFVTGSAEFKNFLGNYIKSYGDPNINLATSHKIPISYK